MSGKINNFPIAVVYDQSYKQTVSYTKLDSGSTVTITGTPNLIIDKNLTTAYQVYASGSGVPAGISITVDYGQVFWNTQLYYKYTILDVVGVNPVEVSIDGTTWAPIDLNTGTVIGYLGIFALRYVRFNTARANDTSTGIDLYECRLMGS